MAEYLVRFTLKVTADLPGDAVDGVVDLFTEKGLRNWVYRVDATDVPEGESSLVGFFDGYGDPMDVSDLLQETPDPEPATPEATSLEDAELNDLAASLNQADENDGTSGQDRESYSDTQDRESYSVES